MRIITIEKREIANGKNKKLLFFRWLREDTIRHAVLAANVTAKSSDYTGFFYKKNFIRTKIKNKLRTIEARLPIQM